MPLPIIKSRLCRDEGCRNSFDIPRHRPDLYRCQGVYLLTGTGVLAGKGHQCPLQGEGVLNLSYEMYLLIGFAYVILLNLAVYRLFVKRTRL